MNLEEIRRGGKAALARALAEIERAPDCPASVALLDAAHDGAVGHVIGLTGPPGVGKSTLMDALIRVWRQDGRRVACIAVDPSSKRSGGALLGDRTRLSTDPEDEGVFVRSMAARDRLGGLAAITVAAAALMRALYDVVLIETVGVGQSETEIAGIADTVLFCVQPGSGDSLQFMKAGIAEIPHVMAVTKSDLGAPAARTRADALAALALGEEAPDGWRVPVLLVSPARREGIEELSAALDAHAAHMAEDGRLARARHRRSEAWLAEAVRERFGSEGLRRAGDLSLAPGTSPFGRLSTLSARLGHSG